MEFLRMIAALTRSSIVFVRTKYSCYLSTVLISTRHLSLIHFPNFSQQLSTINSIYVSIAVFDSSECEHRNQSDHPSWVSETSAPARVDIVVLRARQVKEVGGELEFGVKVHDSRGLLEFVHAHQTAERGEDRQWLLVIQRWDSPDVGGQGQQGWRHLATHIDASSKAGSRQILDRYGEWSRPWSEPANVERRNISVL